MRRSLLLLPAIAGLLLIPQGQTVLGEATADGLITRAQAVTSLLLTRSPKLPPYDSRKEFSDLPAGAWFEAPMRAAEQYGILQADALSRLLPEQSVTRAEFLRMLALTFNLPQHLPFRYTDVPPDVWHARFAGLAERYRLFRESDDSFRLFPNAFVTHQEAAQALAALSTGRKVRPGLSADEDEKRRTREEQEIAREQADGKLQVYLIISTRRVRLNVLAPRPPSSPPPRDHAGGQPHLPALRARLLTLVNDVRARRGLMSLRYNSLLGHSAQTYAEDMAQRGYFSHVSPEGETLADRIQNGGYRDRSPTGDCFCIKGYVLAENLARGQRTPEDAMTAWMRSATHREAILGPEYRDVGFGVAGGYWVQHFGTVVLPSEMDVATKVVTDVVRRR